MACVLVALTHVRLLGVDAATGTKLLYTAVFVVALMLARMAARALVGAVLRGRSRLRSRFWARQGINLAVAVVAILGVLSIWFDNGLHAAAAVGVLSAGLVFALQKVITSVGGYFLILRGDVFSVGDRIVMGGVRGDVISLGFLRTTILEMGQPAGDTDQTVPVWVDGRQYTGRIVTVTNGVVFDEPVFNYSRDFPFLWEELRLPITYEADRSAAERVMLEAARKHSSKHVDVGAEALHRTRRRYFVPAADISLEPEIFYKLTDNWLELAVRFVVPTHNIRRVKSDISRDVLAGFEELGIGIASATTAIVGFPALRFADDPYPADRSAANSANGGARRSRRSRPRADAERD